jgi:hypothetical protein
MGAWHETLSRLRPVGVVNLSLDADRVSVLAGAQMIRRWLARWRREPIFTFELLDPCNHPD